MGDSESTDATSVPPGDELPPLPRPAPPPPSLPSAPSLAENPPPVPRDLCIPGYDILREIGRGGMGVVYQARQVSLNRIVALKMIRRGEDADPAELVRFKTEAEATARLQHPNIVQIHEVGSTEGQPFFSLEYLDGGSLADRLNGAPLPPPQAAAILLTLARAIHYAHLRGVVHRDLKPANVLLAGPRGNETLIERQTVASGSASDLGLDPALSAMKITDFGLAKRVDVDSGQTKTGAVLGTPSYMAPEQAAGLIHAIGPATDIYALGAILYELLTGRPPFRGVNAMETMRQVLEDEPVPPSRLQPVTPRDLETICLKCLEKEPAKRYETADALAEDLRRYRGGEPIVARPAGWLKRLGKWTRRRPAAAALIAVVFLALTAGGVFAYRYIRDLDEANERTAKERDRYLKERDAAQESQRLYLKQRDAALLAQKSAEESERLYLKERDAALLAKKMAEESERRYLKERDAALKAQEEAERNGRRAVRHFRQAVEAVDRMLKRLGMETLARAPYMDETRRKVLEDALAFYEDFLKDAGDDPTLQVEAVRIAERTGSLHLLLGRPDQARKMYDRALQQEQLLLKAHGDVPDLHRVFALVHNNIGLMHERAGNMDQARKQFAEALKRREQLMNRVRAEPEYAYDVACSHLNLAIVARAAKDPKQVDHHLDAGIKIAEKLLEPDPRNPRYRYLLGLLRNDLGVYYFESERYKQAVATHEPNLKLWRDLVRDEEGNFEDDAELARCLVNLSLSLVHLTRELEQPARYMLEAVEIRERLHREHPKMTAYAIDLASALVELGGLYRHIKDHDESIRLATRGIGILLQVLQRERGNSRAREALFNAYMLRVSALQKKERFADAVPDLDELIKLDTTGQGFSLRFIRASFLTEIGKHQEPDQVAHELIAAYPLTLDGWFSMAKLWGNCAHAAVKDAALSEFARVRHLCRYANRALEMLQKAHALGCFRKDEAFRELQTDDSFAAIRDTAGFKAFVKKVEAERLKMP